MFKLVCLRLIARLLAGRQFLAAYYALILDGHDEGQDGEIGYEEALKRWIADYCLLYSLVPKTGAGDQLQASLVALEQDLLENSWVLVAGEDGAIQKFADGCWGVKENPPPIISEKLARTSELEMAAEMVANIHFFQEKVRKFK